MPLYQITSPRYVHGVYHFASSEEPKVIELPDFETGEDGQLRLDKSGQPIPFKLDRGLLPVDAPIEALKPAFAAKRHHSAPPKHTPAPTVKEAAQASKAAAKASARASDESPL